MNFSKALEENLLENYNESYTENGAKGYKTTGKAILDMNFKISSYRNMSENDIIEDFKKVFFEDKTLALQFLFYIRDREEGLGERRLFRVIFKDLAKAYPGYARELMKEVAEYGRYDDLFVLVETPLKTEMLNLLVDQMIADFKAMKENKPISLLAKWLPSINASNRETRYNAQLMIWALQKKDKTFNISRYRKALTQMRNYIDVVEKKMCGDRWSEIKYETVPSRANLIYRNAFLRHDEERRTAYLESLKKGETKINASKLFPYEIYLNSKNGDETTEQLWKALPELSEPDKSVLVVADGSASMTWEHVGNSKATALDVANSLAIYFAERAKGEFKNTYITFSSRPQIVHLGDNNSLYEKKQIARKHSECSNTNIEKTFDLILSTAIENNMAQSDMPTTLLILSDMEFDSAVDYSFNDSLFVTIDKKFKNAGYKMPKLVFWNICGRTNTIPLRQNDNGIALVSGFSTTIFNMVFSNKLDPLQILLEKLNSPRYLRIKEILENN